MGSINLVTGESYSRLKKSAKRRIDQSAGLLCDPAERTTPPSVTAQTHERLVTSALHDLEGLLAPATIEDFFSQHYGRSYRVIPGAPDKGGGLFSWENLNQILAEHRLEHPRLRLERNAAAVPETAYKTQTRSKTGTVVSRLDLAALYQQLRDGATLILDSVQACHGPLARLRDSLSETFLADVQVNLYASWGTCPGFGVHWDDHDVIILQISGRKNWRIFPFTREAPLFRDTVPNDVPPEDALWEGTLSEGDVAYIPRGQWHEAVGLNEPTLHLTIGVRAPTGISTLSWIVDELRHEPLLRRNVPVKGTAGELLAYESEVRELLLSRVSAGFAARHLNHLSGNNFGQPLPDLPRILSDGTQLEHDMRLRFAGITHSTLVREGDWYSFNSVGKVWTVASPCLPVIEALLGRRQHTIAELMELAGGRLSRAELLEFLQGLIEGGLIVRTKTAN